MTLPPKRYLQFRQDVGLGNCQFVMQGWLEDADVEDAVTGATGANGRDESPTIDAGIDHLAFAHRSFKPSFALTPATIAKSVARVADGCPLGSPRHSWKTAGAKAGFTEHC